MADTPAEVRRDIEMTRERMSDTLQELEHKLNVKQLISDHPWPALAAAFGAGVVLAGSNADVKAAAATASATQGAGSKLGVALDTVVASLMASVTQAVQGHVDGWVHEIAGALGTPSPPQATSPSSPPSPSDVSYGVGPTDVVPGKPPIAAPKEVPRAD